MRLLRESLAAAGRTLTIGAYVTAIALAFLLSDRPVAVRAAAAGAWLAFVLGLLWLAVRAVAGARERERRWARQRARLCVRCEYPVSRAMATCPECGGSTRVSPL